MASERVDTSDWIAGADVIGNVGGGLTAAEIIAQSAGDNGFDGYLLNDAQTLLSTDEVCGRIETYPATGTLTTQESGQFTYTGGTGINTATYGLYVNYIKIGVGTITLNVGAGVATIQPSSIASTLSVGTPTVTASGGSGSSIVIQPASIASTMTVGTPTISAGIPGTLSASYSSGQFSGRNIPAPDANARGVFSGGSWRAR